jgi:hypothetical protein
MRFIDDPVGATNAYRETFAMKKADGNRKVVAENLTACGELMSNDRNRKDVYLDYVLSKVNDPDEGLQGLAVSALKGTMDDATLDILFRKLDSKVDIVQIAAVGAIRFRANDGPHGATREQLEATRSRLDDYCRNQVPAFGFLRSELCNR